MNLEETQADAGDLLDRAVAGDQEALDTLFPELTDPEPRLGLPGLVAAQGVPYWERPEPREVKIERTALHWLADKVQGRLPQNHEIEIALEGAKHFYDTLDKMMAGKAEEEV